jgi:hypothetical protein
MAPDTMRIHRVRNSCHAQRSRAPKQQFGLFDTPRGGRVVIEYPNLLQAAKELLRAPKVRGVPGRDGKMSTWVLYGNPK